MEATLLLLFLIMAEPSSAQANHNLQCKPCIISIYHGMMMCTHIAAVDKRINCITATSPSLCGRCICEVMCMTGMKEECDFCKGGDVWSQEDVCPSDTSFYVSNGKCKEKCSSKNGYVTYSSHYSACFDCLRQDVPPACIPQSQVITIALFYQQEEKS